jgi:hypothetical protein
LADLAKDAAKEAEVQLDIKLKAWIKKRFEGPPPVALPSAALQDLLDTVRKDAVSKGIGEPELTRLTTALSRAFN